MNLILKIAILQSYPCQSDFAQAIGLKDDILSRIVRGRRQPTEEQREKISQVLRIPANELFRQVQGAHG